MISKSKDEQLLYEMRMKAIRDENTRVAESEEKGLLMGTVRTLQNVVGEPVSDKDELRSMSNEQLAAIIDKLQKKLTARN